MTLYFHEVAKFVKCTTQKCQFLQYQLGWSNGRHAVIF